jgi:hypothetical protein
MPNRSIKKFWDLFKREYCSPIKGEVNNISGWIKIFFFISLSGLSTIGIICLWIDLLPEIDVSIFTIFVIVFSSIFLLGLWLFLLFSIIWKWVFFPSYSKYLRVRSRVTIYKGLFVRVFLVVLYSCVAILVIYMGLQHLSPKILNFLHLNNISISRSTIIENVTLHVQVIQVILALLVLIGAVAGWYIKKHIDKMESYENRITALNESLAISVQLALKQLPELSYTQHIPIDSLHILEDIYESIYKNKTILEIFKDKEEELILKYIAGLYLFAIGNVGCKEIFAEV